LWCGWNRRLGHGLGRGLCCDWNRRLGRDWSQGLCCDWNRRLGCDWSRGLCCDWNQRLGCGWGRGLCCGRRIDRLCRLRCYQQRAHHDEHQYSNLDPVKSNDSHT
jgi:hypothetical protein